MKYGTTVKFEGNIQYILRDQDSNPIVSIKGEMTKQNNKIWGNYEAKNTKMDHYINIPYKISGYIDQEGYLCLETFTNTFLRGQLTRNKISLNGLNTKGNAIKWIITICNK